MSTVRYLLLACFTTVTIMLFDNTSAHENECAAMTRCSLRKCLKSDVIENAIMNQPTQKMFQLVVESFDLRCIVTECQKECIQCTHCNYAWEQILNIAQGKQTAGKCPKLEACGYECVRADIETVFDCVQKKCNVHCYSGDCKQCESIAQRMFMFLCKKSNLPNRPNIRYNGTCAKMFRDLSEDYVRTRRVA